ncbi:MAG: AAA family ATPase [Candidatus Promineifilaceae bacterium]
MFLEIRLLGGFTVLRDGEPVRAFRTQKTRAALAYLACHAGRPISRDTLAGLFWPESPPRRAAHNLRQTLTFLRQIFGDYTPLHITRQDVAFHPPDDCLLDMLAFQRGLDGEIGDMAALETAVALYRGPLLDGFFISGAPQFEQWLLIQREQLQAGALALLSRLADWRLARGEYQLAQVHLRRALALEPWQETTHRDLMRALALAGQSDAALEQYQQCRRVLQEGLGVAPLPETEVLYRQILAGKTLPPAALPTERPQLQFVGRAGEHAQLAAALAAIRRQPQAARQPRLLLLEGEAGAGKTRLAEEFIRYAAGREALILRGGCFEFGETLPYQPIADALRLALSQAADALSPVWLAELARVLPELRDLRPDLPPPQPADGLAARQRLFTAVLRFLQALATGGQTLLLFLDDLHWADAATLDLLHFLLRHMGERPFLCLGAFRPEETPAPHPLTTLRRGLSRSHLVSIIPLPALPESVLQTAAADLVGADAARPFGDFLYRESEGNPFMLSEMLNSLYETAALRPGAPGRWILDAARETAATPLSVSVRDTILYRVERLPQPSQRLLQLAAIAGQRFDAALLSEAAGQEAEAIARELDAWLERRLVRPSANAYDFAHDKIREVVYHDLPSHQRQLWHGRIGDALAARYDNRVEQALPPAIAHHYRHSQRPKQAIPWLLLAAKEALAFTAVIHFCDQALALEPDDADTRFEFLRLRQRMYEFLGDAAAEEADAAAMLALAEQLTDKRRAAAAWQRLSIFYTLRGRLEEARQTAEQAWAAARQVQDTAGEVDALIQLGIVARDMDGDADSALRLFQQGQALAQETGYRMAEATSLGHIAILRAEGGAYGPAVADYQACLDIFRALGLRQDVAGYLNPLAALYRALGQYDLAAAALDEALCLSEELEHAQIQAWTHLNLGRLALYQGQLAAAQAAFARARPLARVHHMLLLEGHTLSGLGQVALAQGDAVGAQQDLMAALTIFDGVDAGAMVLTRGHLSRVWLALGEVAVALVHSTAAVTAVESGRGSFIEGQQVYLYHYHALAADGRLAEARRWLAKGRAMLLAQAEGLAGEWRESLLTAVPANREMMALSDAFLT